jgi:CheY-like chemotaxis protein
MTRRSLLVLVADACPDVTETLALLLQAWGHEPLTASDGPAALQLALSRRPDVAILDLALPRLGGLDVARRLEAVPGACPLLWALTGYGGPEDRRRAAQAGFALHLLKPFDPERLRDLLAAAVPRRTAEARAEATA